MEILHIRTARCLVNYDGLFKKRTRHVFYYILKNQRIESNAYFRPDYSTYTRLGGEEI